MKAPAVRAFRFPKAQRLLNRPEIDTVTRGGRRVPVRHFLLFAASNTLGYPRLGIIVSRRVGNAVLRNRVKRRVREWFRHTAGDMDPWDLVVIARRGAPHLGVEQVARELDGALARLTRHRKKTP